MPVIDLPSEQPLAGASVLFFPVQAVMYFPRDEGKRAQWFAAAMTACYARWREEGASPEILSDFHGWLGELWNFRLAPRRVFQDGIDRTKRASLSGHALIYLLRAARHHPAHCKLERVKVIISNLTKPGDAQAGYSESLVEKLWPEFKSVSHLWAAFDRLLRSGDWDPERDSEVVRFLSLAEAFRQLGISARLLGSEETWRAPDTIQAAEEPEILPFEEDILELLSSNFLGS